jgi:hypothetical protein
MPVVPVGISEVNGYLRFAIGKTISTSQLKESDNAAGLVLARIKELLI